MEFPFTISNGYGEHITFLGFEENDMGSNVLALQNEVAPGDGPPMHVHFKQDEKLTVIEGKLAYQMPGGEINYCNEGESVTFNAGTPHKFWNAGDKVMRCKGWISPPNTIIYFLSAIYQSAKENKAHGRPGTFDTAYLLNKYGGEYDFYEIPAFVKKIIFPITLFFGKLAGKHKKFADAPDPV